MTALWIGPSQELARHWLADPSRLSLTDAAPRVGRRRMEITDRRRLTMGYEEIVERARTDA